MTQGVQREGAVVPRAVVTIAAPEAFIVGRCIVAVVVEDAGALFLLAVHAADFMQAVTFAIIIAGTILRTKGMTFADISVARAVGAVVFERAVVGTAFDRLAAGDTLDFADAVTADGISFRCAALPA